jgi:hypothetical protein
MRRNEADGASRVPPTKNKHLNRGRAVCATDQTCARQPRPRDRRPIAIRTFLRPVGRRAPAGALLRRCRRASQKRPAGGLRRDDREKAKSAVTLQALHIHRRRIVSKRSLITTPLGRPAAAFASIWKF